MTPRSATGDDPIAALAARFNLPPQAPQQLNTLVEALQAGGAPSAIHDRAQVIDDHLADSLVALGLPEVATARRIADLGAGAGLPGLPLAIALPHARVTLVESNARKCEFIARTARACDLENVVVVRERAELWRDGLTDQDLVTARALAALPVVAEYAAPLLIEEGALVAWRGRRDGLEEAQAARAAAELGLHADDPVPVAPYHGALHRHLHVLRKVAPSPARFPRRPGVARKHPLGAS